MSILTKTLPKTVEIAGRQVAIRTEYAVGIEFELLMQDESLSQKEKLQKALALYYEEIPLWDVPGAVDAILRFYRCGAELEKSPGGESKTHKKAYCFRQDAGLIFAAFLGEYGINLARVEDLHWWEFRALFLGLSAECEFKKVMGYRTADLKGMSKAQKKTYEKLRKFYALKNTKSSQGAVSLAQRDMAMKAYVARRFEEASLAKEKT